MIIMFNMAQPSLILLLVSSICCLGVSMESRVVAVKGAVVIHQIKNSEWYKVFVHCTLIYTVILYRKDSTDHERHQ